MNTTGAGTTPSPVIDYSNFYIVTDTDYYTALALGIFYGIVVILPCLYPCYKHVFRAQKERSHNDSKTDINSSNNNNNHNDNNNNSGSNSNSNNNENERKDYFVAIVTEAWRVKVPYLIAIIHYLDTITDQLLLIEWYYFDLYYDVPGNGINFAASLGLAVVCIVAYRIVTGMYLYSYYNGNIWYFIAQIFDVGIGFEVRESHLRYDVTDNLQYLSKLEQTYETTPFLLLQLYVFLRLLPTGIKLPPVTIISMLTSFLSLLSKLIIDDAAVFLEDETVSKRKIVFWRLTFRICELLGRLLIITLVGAYLGLYFVLFWLLLEFSTNAILYDKGLLGAQALNFVSYIASVNNLGLAPQRGHRLVSASYWQNHLILKKFYDAAYWILMKLEFYLIPFKTKLIPTDFHYLGYIYIRGKTIQGFLLAFVLLGAMLLDLMLEEDYECPLDMCTSIDVREALVSSENYYVAIDMLVASIVCLIVYQVSFRLFLYKYLRLGSVLSRDPWVLIRNGKWGDGLRALRSANGKATRLDMIKILKKVIDDRIDLPSVPYKQHKWCLDLPQTLSGETIMPRTNTTLSEASAAPSNVYGNAGGVGGISAQNTLTGDVATEQPEIDRKVSTKHPYMKTMKMNEFAASMKKETGVIVAEINRYWKNRRDFSKQASVHVSTIQRQASSEASGDDDNGNLSGRVVHRGGNDEENPRLVPAHHQDMDTMDMDEYDANGDSKNNMGDNEDDMDDQHFLFDLFYYALENDHTSFIEFFLNSYVYSRINDFKPLEWRFNQYSNLLYFVIKESVSTRNEILQRLIFYLNPLAKRRDESTGQYPLTLLINPSFEPTLEFCLQDYSNHLFNYIIDMSLDHNTLKQCIDNGYYQILFKLIPLLRTYIPQKTQKSLLDDLSIRYSYQVVHDQPDANGVIDRVWREDSRRVVPAVYAIEVKKSLKCSQLLIKDFMRNFNDQIADELKFEENVKMHNLSTVKIGDNEMSVAKVRQQRQEQRRQNKRLLARIFNSVIANDWYELAKNMVVPNGREFHYFDLREENPDAFKIAKVDVNQKDSKGNVPLEIACGAPLQGFNDTVGGSASQQISEDVRDLGEDFMEERIDFVKYLLDHGAIVNFETLKAASQYSDSERLMDVLLNQGEAMKSLNKVDSQSGNTLLMIACQYTNENVVKVLIKRGADTEIENKEGKKAIDFLPQFDVNNAESKDNENEENGNSGPAPESALSINNILEMLQKAQEKSQTEERNGGYGDDDDDDDTAVIEAAPSLVSDNVLGAGPGGDKGFVPRDKSEPHGLQSASQAMQMKNNESAKPPTRLDRSISKEKRKTELKLTALEENVNQVIQVMERNYLIVFSELMNGNNVLSLQESVSNSSSHNVLANSNNNNNDKLISMTLSSLLTMLPKIQVFSSRQQANFSKLHKTGGNTRKDTLKGAVLKYLILFNHEVFDLRCLTKLLMDRRINIEVFRPIVDAIYDICFLYTIDDNNNTSEYNQGKLEQYRTLVNKIFYYACGEFNRYEIAEFLLEKERKNKYVKNSVSILNINWQNEEIEDGYGNVNLWTPLINAALHGNSSIVELLCQYRELDINYRDKWGFSAMSHAFLYPHMDCYIILRNYGSLHSGQRSNDAHELDPSNFVLDEKRGQRRLFKKNGNNNSNFNRGNSHTNTNVNNLNVNDESKYESDIAIDMSNSGTNVKQKNNKLESDNELADLFTTKRQYIEQVLSYYLTVQQKSSKPRTMSDRFQLASPNDAMYDGSDNNGNETSKFGEHYFVSAILNKVIVPIVDTEAWERAVLKGNVLLAVDYLNEICAKEVYEEILLKLFQEPQFTDNNNLTNILEQASFVARMISERRKRKEMEAAKREKEGGNVSTTGLNDIDSGKSADSVNGNNNNDRKNAPELTRTISPRLTDLIGLIDANKLSLINSQSGGVGGASVNDSEEKTEAITKENGTRNWDDDIDSNAMKDVVLKFPSIGIWRDDKDEIQEMNDVLIVERLITAYNNKYSSVKVANYRLNNQRETSTKEDKLLQRGMERIFSEAVHYKFGLTNPNTTTKLSQEAGASFSQKRNKDEAYVE